jgi:hypothetical protein
VRARRRLEPLAAALEARSDADAEDGSRGDDIFLTTFLGRWRRPREGVRSNQAAHLKRVGIPDRVRR